MTHRAFFSASTPAPTAAAPARAITIQAWRWWHDDCPLAASLTRW